MIELDPKTYFRNRPGRLEDRGVRHNTLCPSCGRRAPMHLFFWWESDERGSIFCQCDSCKATWRLAEDEARRGGWSPGTLGDAERFWLENARHYDRSPKHGGRSYLPGEPPPPVVFKNTPVMIVGNQLVYTAPGRTIHELLRTLVAHALGTKWADREMGKPEDERHPIAQWFHDWNRVIFDSPDSKPIGSTKYEAPADGGSWRLLLLGRDLWQLQHSDALPKSLKARLRDPVHFQGALHEIAVAAIVARAGYRISWNDARRSPTGRPEFVGTPLVRGSPLEVEAKSRHRPGVLGQAGQRNASGELIVDVRGLLRDAMRKDPAGRAYLIFIDLNSPSRLTQEAARRLLAEIEAMTTGLVSKGVGPGDGFNALIVTNIAHHYGQALSAPPLPWYAVFPRAKPQFPFEERALQRIVESLLRYEELPHVDPDT